MTAKRFFSAILSLVMAISLVFGTLATQVIAFDSYEVNESEDLSFENLETVSVEYTTDQLNICLFDYVSLEEAAATVHANFVNHVSDFTVYFFSTCATDREAYNQLSNIVLAHNGNPTEGDYIARQLGDVRVLVYLTVYEGMNYFKMSFSVPYFTTLEQEAELDLAISAALDSLNLYNATDYQKVKGIYDFICRNVSYDYTNVYDPSNTIKYSAYAALVNKTAVCQGYALLFYRMALSLGIDCRIVGGYANGGSHAWNIVKLGGRYFNLDATWDAGKSKYRYFLKSDANFTDHVKDAAYLDSAFVSSYPVSSEDFYEDEFTVIDGTLISYNGLGGNVTVPENVIEIAEGAFRNAANIEQITIPASVISIGDSALDCNASKIVFKSLDTFIFNSFSTIRNGAVICGYEGSTSQAYAQMFGHEFIAIYENHGDIDGDGVVSSDDAIYLLYASIFGTEEYPVYQDCDYNNNGMIDEEDATYLLYHTMFGAEEYPLY